MKLIRQARLVQRGTRVYEIDLCEVAPDRFVVNFRHGRVGVALDEGSETALPVDRAEADRVFDRLVAARIARGFTHAEPATSPAWAPDRPGAAPPPATPAADAEGPTLRERPSGPDRRHERLVELLVGGATGRMPAAWTSDPDRVIWRAGELAVRGAADPIAALITDDADTPPDDRRVWNACRALLRCVPAPDVADGADGSDSVPLRTVRAVADSAAHKPWVRSMARHAVLALAGPSERAARAADLRAGMPGAVHGWLDAPAEPGKAVTRAVVAEVDAAPELLDALYALVTLDPRAHARFVALLHAVPSSGNPFLGLRRVLKAAEARDDGEVWGAIVRRIERDPKAGGNRPVPKVKPGRRVFERPRGGTRKYLRRRGWRVLYRLGSAAAEQPSLGAAYCRMAAGLLLAYADDDARSGGTGPAYERFAGQWAFNHVLYGDSPTFRPRYPHLTFAIAYHRGIAPHPGRSREEAFPALWDDATALLAELLDRSRCAEVHLFAARALRANPGTWRRIPVARLIGWFSAPYVETATLAADVAVTRYDPTDPDLELVLALLGCVHDGARGTAEGWVRANPSPFLRSVPFVVGVVLSRIPATRRLALELLGAASMLPDQAAAVVEAVRLAALRTDPADPDGTARLRDATAVLVAAFPRDLAALPLDRVAELLRHPAEGVAELGARILVLHRVRPAELPDELLAAALTSVHPVVRGLGIRLYGELPDAVLAERFRVLVHLVTSAHADVRAAVVPIVVRLAGANRAFAKVLLGALIPMLTASQGDDGAAMQRDVIRLLRTDLAAALPLVDPAQVFRLLRAKETLVQELGGELLRTNVDPRELRPAQLAILASSDVLGVRRTAWRMLAARIDDVREEPECVLQLVDGRWPDSRAEAFAFVEQQIGFDHLPAEVALGVCDSVRPDVQAFGRKLVVSRFEHADGNRYLTRLAQHPSSAMQAFAAAWLEQHAAGQPDRIARLVPFIVSVLTRPNQGRVAKLRVLAFLDSQVADRACAEVIAPLVSELSLTIASSHRERYVALLTDLRRRHPDLATPLRIVPPEARGASQST